MSAGCASHEVVGFESAKTIGRSLFLPICRTIVSVNVPGCPERPRSAVGFARVTTSSSDVPTRSTTSRGFAKGFL